MKWNKSNASRKVEEDKKAKRTALDELGPLVSKFLYENLELAVGINYQGKDIHDDFSYAVFKRTPGNLTVIAQGDTLTSAIEKAKVVLNCPHTYALGECLMCEVKEGIL